MRSLFIIFTLCFGFVANAAELQGPHTHGEIELSPTWDADQQILTLHFVAPAQDLIGYERDPDSAREKKALRDFDENFDPLKLIKMNSESNCLFKDGRSSSDLFSAVPHKHGLFDKTHSHPVGIDGHVDFKLVYRYTCTQLPVITFDIFKAYPSVKKINIRAEEIQGEIKTIVHHATPILDLTNE